MGRVSQVASHLNSLELFFSIYSLLKCTTSTAWHIDTHYYLERKIQCLMTAFNSKLTERLMNEKRREKKTSKVHNRLSEMTWSILKKKMNQSPLKSITPTLRTFKFWTALSATCIANRIRDRSVAGQCLASALHSLRAISFINHSHAIRFFLSEFILRCIYLDAPTTRLQLEKSIVIDSNRCNNTFWAHD